MSLLLEVLRQPERLSGLSLAQWDGLVRMARHTRLLGKLQAFAAERDLLEAIPEAPRRWLIADRVRSDYLHKRVRNELVQIVRTLDTDRIPLVLLKGAAYIGAGLPAAEGRRLADLDLLVPRIHLDYCERALLAAGWQGKALSDYDQHYYRAWSHELPPLKHPARGLEVDIHHNLTPPTSRLRLDESWLLRDAVRLDDAPEPFCRCWVLAPVDLWLHSATHLLFNDELRGGLRDLVDLHQLGLHFVAQDNDFWYELSERALQLGLGRPAWYALTSLTRLLQTPVPDTCLWRLQRRAPAAPIAASMARLTDRLLVPSDPEHMAAPVSKWLLYVRSHWVRMPPLMLARHLLTKARLRYAGTA